MNISLSGILSQINNGTNPQEVVTSHAPLSAQKAMQATSILESLSIGQTIGGVVKSVNGNNLLLEIAKGVEINAKLEGQIDVSAGKNLLFEVKSNAGGKVSLSPLFTNMAGENNAGVSALSAAGLPPTAQNLKMVSTMMEEGMSIDRNSLYEMSHATLQFPGANPATLVHLKAMGMDLNETNIAQYEATDNLQHHITDSILNFSDETGKLLSSFGESGEFAQGLTLMKDMLQGLSAVAIKPDGSLEIIQPEEMTVVPESNVHSENTSVILSENEEKLPVLEEAALAIKEEQLENTPLSLADKLKSTVTEMTKLQSSLEALEKDGAPTPEQLHESLKQLQESYRDLVKGFGDSLRGILQEKWAIAPEDFADKEKVKSFYKETMQEVSALKIVFDQNSLSDTSSGKAITNLQQNLEFMDNINQLFPYLQIPLKTALDTKQGELYVYGRKGGKVNEDGSCSALLHLDMQHLGSMDIYVRLKDKDVSTRFMLQNEEELDFLEAHMDLLTKRLSDKGYKLGTTFELSGEGEEGGSIPVSPIDRIRGKEGEERVISYTSFDVRA